MDYDEMDYDEMEYDEMEYDEMDPMMSEDYEEYESTPQITAQMVRPAQPQVVAPRFSLVLPFAAFDRSTPTKLAGSILNWSALAACLALMFLLGKYGYKSGRTISVYIICMIFTLATTIILSSSGYQR
jgi:hypothetical protein